MASTSTPSANEPANNLILVHTLQLKPMIKAQISGTMISSCIVKLMMIVIIIIIIMNKSQEMTVFGGH